MAGKFSRGRPQPRGRLVNVRCTEAEKELLAALAPLVGAAGQSEVVRLALDYYLEHSPEARAALRRLRGQ